MSDYRQQIESLTPEQRNQLRALLSQRKTAAERQRMRPDGVTALSESRSTVATARSSAGDYPLSYAQWVMWFPTEIAPDSCAYNVGFATRIRSAVDAPLLKRSFELLIQRHPALRTTCHGADERPRQRVHEYMPGDFTHLRLQSTDDASIAGALRSACERLFDLAHGPALRVALFSLSDDEHVMLLAGHHVIVDLWSIRILLEELPIVYRALAENTTPRLPKLEAGYADFVTWQNEYLSTAEARESLQYWKRRLSGLPLPLDLPQDRLRPPMPSLRGGSHTFALEADLSHALRELAAAQGKTLYAVLLSAFEILIHLLTGASDVLVGSPVAARISPEFHSVVGCFINFIVMRGDLSGDPTYDEFLSRLFPVILNGLNHQAYPFSVLTERLEIPREPSRAPLTGIGFSFDKASTRRQSGNDGSNSGLPIETYPFLEQQEGQFDLFLEMADLPEGAIVGSLRFSADLFDASTAGGWLDDFKWLLREIGVNPKRRISELAILRCQEHDQRVAAWNATRIDIPSEWLAHELFERQAARNGNAVAALCGGEDLTYAELNRRANKLARRLVNNGVGPESVVALLDNRGLDFLVAILGVWKAGAAFLPLDPHSPPARQRQIIQQSGSPILLAGNAFRERAEDVCSELDAKVCEIASFSNDNETSDENLARVVDERNLAYVIFTSGSTGQPKGVMIEHRGMLNHLWVKVRDLHITTDDAVAQTASQCFDISVWQFVAPLLAGARTVIIPDDVVQTPPLLLEELAAQSVSIFETVPTLLWALIEEIEVGPRKQLTLRSLLTTGEALVPELARNWFRNVPDVEIVNAYGPTECSDDVTHQFLTRLPKGAQRIPIGRALANTQLYVLDEDMRTVPIGVPGELYVGGVGVGRGYLKNPAQTALSFAPDPFSGSPGARLYRTGDRVRYTPGGELEFLGRVDHQVKLRGFRIELGEIEAILRQHEQIEWAAVIMREPSAQAPMIVAYVRPWILESAPSSAELRDYLAQRLPRYMVPAAFVALREIPATRNGKLDAQSLPMPELLAESQIIEPRTPLEKQLVRLWSAALNCEQVGIHRNFFELGGDSIATIQIVARAGRENLALTSRDIYLYPTVAELAEHLSRRESPAFEPIFPASGARPERNGPATTRPDYGPQDEDRYPLSAMQEGLLFHAAYAPEAGMYVVRLRVGIDGPLNPAELRDRWRRAISRHGALRTSFHYEGVDRAFQAVNSSVELRWRHLDWSRMDPAEQEAAFDRYLAQDRQQDFRLDEAPLFRVAIFQTGEARYELLFTFHHLILDGWSAALLLEEVFSADPAAHASLPEPPPFRAYIDYLESQDLAQAEGFWRNTLAGFSATTPIGGEGLARERAFGQGEHHGRVLVLDRQSAEALRATARQRRLTLQTIFRGTWALLLGRLTGKRDVVFGATLSGRSAPLKGIDQMVGLLINTLPVRVRIDEQNLLAWLRGLQDWELQARQFEYTPLTKIASWTDLPRNSALFQSNLVFENYPVSSGLRNPTGRLRIASVRTYERGNYPLTFLVIPGEEIVLQLAYDASVLSRERADALLDLCRALLDEIVRNPERPISHFYESLRTRHASTANGHPAIEPELPERPVDEYAPAVTYAASSSEPAGQAPHDEPQTPVQRKIARLWAEALGKDDIGLHQNFFELGGDSIGAMRLISRINRALRIQIPIRSLFENPTVASFEKELQRLSAQRRPPPTTASVTHSVDANGGTEAKQLQHESEYQQHAGIL